MDSIKSVRQIVAQRSTRSSGGSTIIQFLSLYLLVLAFFILLVTISTFEEVKSNAVMNSLNSMFKPVIPPSTDLTVFTSKSGRILAAEDFQNHVKGLFATTLGVEKVEVVQPGRLMRVVMAADSLFVAETTTIRDANIPLVDRIIASLSGRPPGFHFDMEFVIGSEQAPNATMPSGQTLQMARAGAFVRSMFARGVPPDTVSIGMQKGNPNVVTMWFYVRSPKEVEEYYDSLRGDDDEIEDIPGDSNGG